MIALTFSTPSHLSSEVRLLATPFEQAINEVSRTPLSSRVNLLLSVTLLQPASIQPGDVTSYNRRTKDLYSAIYRSTDEWISARVADRPKLLAGWCADTVFQVSNELLHTADRERILDALKQALPGFAPQQSSGRASHTEQDKIQLILRYDAGKADASTVEELLERAVGEICDIDGHDRDPSTVNVYMYCSDLSQATTALAHTIDRGLLPADCRVGVLDDDGSYRTLLPANRSHDPFPVL